MKKILKTRIKLKELSEDQEKIDKLFKTLLTPEKKELLS
jgi:hypothetical protein